MMQRRRAAFTLFELILAIALSAALLALIGMAINLYLTRISMSRDRVEEAQLARSVLSMIADDLRATAIYQSQDVSDVAQLMAETASFDVDSIDDERSGSNSSTSAPGGTTAPGSAGTSGTTTSISSALSSGGTGTSGSDGSAQSSNGETYESEMPLGVNGGIGDVYVDVERLPRGDELFGTLTGYTNAPMAVTNANSGSATGASWGTTPVPSDLKTIRYFIREGDRSEASGLAATSLAPDMQASAGGLVRQEIPHSARLFAEQTANSAVLESGQVLIAPEVVHIEFRYFDGQQVVDMWDMAEQQSLPLAVEVRIWLTSPSEAAASAAAYDAQSLLSTAREYRQTVFLPMAELTQNASGGGAGGTSSGSSSSSSSSTTGSSSSGSSSIGSSAGSSAFGSGSN